MIKNWQASTGALLLGEEGIFSDFTVYPAPSTDVFA